METKTQKNESGRVNAEKKIDIDALEWGGKTGFKDFRQAYVAAGGKLIQPIRNKKPRIGRNDPCHCGSGHKFKNCCG